MKRIWKWISRSKVPKLSRFRVNAFNQHRGAAAVFRTVPNKVLTLDDLGMGKVFQDLAEQARGLVLVTGPTGSGKSTNLGGHDRLRQRYPLRPHSDH